MNRLRSRLFVSAAILCSSSSFFVATAAFSPSRIRRARTRALFDSRRPIVSETVVEDSDAKIKDKYLRPKATASVSPSAPPSDRRSFLSSATMASCATAAALLTTSGVGAATAAVSEGRVPERSAAAAPGDSSSSPLPGPSDPPLSAFDAAGGGVVAASTLPKRTDARFFIAGGASAAISHGLATPVDVVKTRIQADPETYSGGVQKAALKILDKEGPSALLGGLGPTVVGYCVEGALKFGAYEALKPVALSLLPSVDPAEPYLIAAVIAGALASILLCPIEETRIRVVTDPTFAKGLVDGLPKLVKEEGILSTFSGIYAMFSKQVPYTMAKQVSFDEFTELLYPLFAGYAWLPAYELKFGVDICAAFLASILACIASHPGDVLLTATYKKGDGKSGFRDTVSGVYESKGIGGFFQGISARFIHVGAIITLQLVLYDEIKGLLGLPSTGS